ncbi:hypothetical protein GGP81_003306 [Salinibacter ruber]|nr:hypothetical protein [Salinibacter ruber]MCS4088251.1 hypothetical protein [Salinibacter ruber]
MRFVFANREIRAGHDATSVVYSSVCLCVSTLRVYNSLGNSFAMPDA